MSVEWYFHPEQERWYHIKIDIDAKILFIDGEEYNYSKEEVKKDGRESKEQ